VYLETSGGGRYLFAGDPLPVGDHLVRTATDLGFELVAGQKVFLYTSDRNSVMDAARLEAGLHGRHPEGTGRWLLPQVGTPGSPNSFSFHDEVVINEIMYHHRPEAESPPVIEETVLLPLDAVWKYDQSGRTDLGTGWKERGFDDGTWPDGKALLYNETAVIPGTKNTPLNLGPITFYFRTWFDFDGDPERAELALQHVIDDGAIVYLNG